MLNAQILKESILAFADKNATSKAYVGNKYRQAVMCCLHFNALCDKL
jgi:hypothetical protein